MLSGHTLTWLTLLVLIASSCLIEPIPGDPPLRYRDAVFTYVDKTSDIVYGNAQDQLGSTIALTLDLYQPVGDTVTRRPLAIWVHGGYFSGGDKTSPEILEEATAFARKGYVVASINYRTSPNGCRPPLGGECIQAIYDANADAQAAVRYLRAAAATYRIDTTRVAIAGSSAGAITALNVGYGLVSPGATPPSAASQVGGAISLSGAEVFTSAVTSDDAPALLFHGSADDVVPYSLATDTVAAAQAVDLEADLVTWEGEGHLPYDSHRDQIIDLTTNFIYHALNVGDAAG